MKDEDLKSNHDDKSVNNGELPEVKAVPIEEELKPNTVPHEEIADDDVIIYLDDSAETVDSEAEVELLTHRPGEEDVLTEFERLPEVKATIVDGIPEVVNVDEITSLISEDVDSGWSHFLADKVVFFDRCKEYVVTHQKWLACAAAVVLVAVIAAWSPSTNATSEPTQIVEANASAEVFDQWVDQALTGHLLEIGEKK